MLYAGDKFSITAVTAEGFLDEFTLCKTSKTLESEFGEFGDDRSAKEQTGECIRKSAKD